MSGLSPIRRADDTHNWEALEALLAMKPILLAWAVLWLAGCAATATLPASQTPPASEVEPVAMDSDEFYGNLLRLEWSKDCGSLRKGLLRIGRGVEEYSAAYNRASKQDPVYHAAEVASNKLADALLHKMAGEEPKASLDPALLTKYELAETLAVYKGALDAALRSWVRACRDSSLAPPSAWGNSD